MISRSKLGARLLSASGFVRQGARFADIGTDHAYLPLFLLSEGKISFAVCSDINEGPLKTAKENAARHGFSDKTDFVLCDGAFALSEKNITDYAICGMGGELIAEIIENAPNLKNGEIRLILQPMTKVAFLRRYLAKSGFSVVCEEYSSEKGKYYVTLAAEYTKEPREISDFEAELGKLFEKGALTPDERGYLESRIKAIKRVIRGKKAGGESFFSEEGLLTEIKRKTDL